MDRSFLRYDSFGGEFFLDPSKIARVWVAKASSSTPSVSFMMYTVPYDLVVQSCGDTSPHCEDQLPNKCFLQQFKYFAAFLIVRKVGSPTRARIVLAISSPSLHVVVDDDGLAVVGLAPQVLIYIVLHLSIWLIPSHVSEDSRADGTFSPFFRADELDQAGLVVDMRASKHKNIIIELFGEFLLYIFDLELLQADHAFFLLHFAFGEFELDRGEIVDFKHVMILLLLCSVLFIDKVDYQRHHFEIFMLAGDIVSVVQAYLPLLFRNTLHEELVLGFFFHHCIKDQKQVQGLADKNQRQFDFNVIPLQVKRIDDLMVKCQVLWWKKW